MKLKFASAVCRWVPDPRWKGDYILEVGYVSLWEIVSDALKSFGEVIDSTIKDKCLIIVDLMAEEGPKLTSYIGVVPVKYFGICLELGGKVDIAKDKIVAGALSEMRHLIH